MALSAYRLSLWFESVSLAISAYGLVSLVSFFHVYYGEQVAQQ